MWCEPMKDFGYLFLSFWFYGCSTCEERFTAPEEEFVCVGDSGSPGSVLQACTGSQVGYLVCDPEWLCNTPPPSSECYYCTTVEKVREWESENCKNACRVSSDTLGDIIPDTVIHLTCRY